MSVGTLEQYITTRVAAEQLGVSLRRIQQLCQSGKLVTVQVGRELLIDQNSLTGVTIYGKAGRPPKPKADEATTKGSATIEPANAEPTATAAKPKRKRASKKGSK